MSSTIARQSIHVRRHVRRPLCYTSIYLSTRSRCLIQGPARDGASERRKPCEGHLAVISSRDGDADAGTHAKGGGGSDLHLRALRTIYRSWFVSSYVSVSPCFIKDRFACLACFGCLAFITCCASGSVLCLAKYNPHGLQRVLGPSGPVRRHCLVSVVLQLKHPRKDFTCTVPPESVCSADIDTPGSSTRQVPRSVNTCRSAADPRRVLTSVSCWPHRATWRG